MLYAIRHTTTYLYRTDVSAARCILHLQPATAGSQRVFSAHLLIDPKPVEYVEARDFFGNRTAHVRFAGAAARHRFESRVRIDVRPSEPPHALLTPSWRDVRREALLVAGLDGAAPAHYLFATRFVPLLDEARAYAQPSFEPGRPVLDAAVDMMRRIHADFVYDPLATDVSTPLDVVARTRHGVCQDFAHWMIAGLRCLGIPAAYVSGYLRTHPPPGKERLVGADATHAWVSVWCGAGLGWVDLDPTNAVLAGEDHIRVAAGRDYADVAPVDGVVVASAGHTLRVSVDVAPMG
ncbi:transglutaminase family protein [Labrys monachus]|uniref:Transglutaminase-like putative cysteine protease n=1 Tax=Labrys monachus TaxID=217067 RepID=A0ABU0FMM9_9HYPH|nr:transglutaminase family protein [Labrys monachus]MDQ0395310.1 transglutaminase-like putative cysteine protease [Labrys monachus]